MVTLNIFFKYQEKCWSLRPFPKNLRKLGLKVVSATFLLVCFICLKESYCKTRKNAFYFTSEALLVLEIIKF